MNFSQFAHKNFLIASIQWRLEQAEDLTIDADVMKSLLGSVDYERYLRSLSHRHVMDKRTIEIWGSVQALLKAVSIRGENISKAAKAKFNGEAERVLEAFYSDISESDREYFFRVPASSFEWNGDPHYENARWEVLDQFPLPYYRFMATTVSSAKRMFQRQALEELLEDLTGTQPAIRPIKSTLRERMKSKHGIGN